MNTIYPKYKNVRWVPYPVNAVWLESEALHAAAVNMYGGHTNPYDWIDEGVQYTQRSMYTILWEETECDGESESDSCAGESEYSFQTRSPKIRAWNTINFRD